MRIVRRLGPIPWICHKECLGLDATYLGVTFLVSVAVVSRTGKVYLHP